MALEQAGRKDDPVAVTGAGRGMYIGAATGGVIGGIVGALGGLGVGAAPGAGIGISLGSDIGKFLGRILLPSQGGRSGDVGDGSHDVLTNRRPQARIGDPTRKGKLVEGAMFVTVNQRLASRRNDHCEQGWIEKGSPNVWIGGPPVATGEWGDGVDGLESFVLSVVGGTLSGLAKATLLVALRKALIKKGTDAALDAYQDYLRSHGYQAQARFLEIARQIRKAQEGREKLATLLGRGR